MKRLLLIMSLAIAIVSASRMFLVAKDQLSAPFDIADESPQLSTIRVIQRGENIYDPVIYNEPPFILTMYTPAYHYLVASLPEDPSNRFFTGRMVATIFMISASFCLLFPRRLTQNVTFAILAMACFFLIHEVASDTVRLRNDSAALFFSAVAVILAERANKKPWGIVLVALVSFIAFTCKQSYLAATASCLLYFILRRRCDALSFCVSLLCLFIGWGLFSWFFWGDGYWFSIFVAPRNPIFLEVFSENWARILRQPFFVFLLLLTLSTTFYVLYKERWKAIKESPFLIYFFVSGMVLIVTLGKVGSGVNCFFEPVLAGLLWMVFLAKRINMDNIPRGILIILSLLIVCVVLEIKMAERSDYSLTTREDSIAMVEYIRQVKEEIREVMPQRGEILNLALGQLAFELQKDPVLNDPILYSILWETGVLNINQLIACVVDQKFGVIMLGNDLHTKNVLKTQRDYLDRAILAFYEKKKVGRCYYFSPKSSISQNAQHRSQKSFCDSIYNRS